MSRKAKPPKRNGRRVALPGAPSVATRRASTKRLAGDGVATRRARTNNHSTLTKDLLGAIERDRRAVDPRQRTIETPSERWTRLRGGDPKADAASAGVNEGAPWKESTTYEVDARVVVGDEGGYLVFGEDGACVACSPNLAAAQKRAGEKGRVVPAIPRPQKEVARPIAGLRALIHNLVTRRELRLPSAVEEFRLDRAKILAEAWRRPVEAGAVVLYPTWKDGQLARVPDAVAALADEVLAFHSSYDPAELGSRRRALPKPLRVQFDSAIKRAKRYQPPPICPLATWIVNRWRDVKNMTVAEIADRAAAELKQKLTAAAVRDTVSELGLGGLRKIGRPSRTKAPHGGKEDSCWLIRGANSGPKNRKVSDKRSNSGRRVLAGLRRER